MNELANESYIESADKPRTIYLCIYSGAFETVILGVYQKKEDAEQMKKESDTHQVSCNIEEHLLIS